MSKVSLNGASLYVEVVGSGFPVALMHGGPGLDYTTMLPLRPLADQFTLVFYDHRCNGQSQGADVSSMTFENLCADADALRQALGYEKWAVLGHSFGGNVALEYALRYPEGLSHLILMDTGGDQWWVQHNAPELLAKRGYSNKAVLAARRFYNGCFVPDEFLRVYMRFGSAYNYGNNFLYMIKALASGHLPKMNPEALIYGYSTVLNGWSVMDRLGSIETPTLILAGRQDFLFPPEHQVELAAGIPNARLELIERAGHNPHLERPKEVQGLIRGFLADAKPS